MLAREQCSLRSDHPAENGARLMHQRPMDTAFVQTMQPFVKQSIASMQLSKDHHPQPAGCSPTAETLVTHSTMHAAKLARNTQTDVYGQSCWFAPDEATHSTQTLQNQSSKK
jgi:hypothetical protein